MVGWCKQNLCWCHKARPLLPQFSLADFLLKGGGSPCSCELTQLTWRESLRLWVDPAFLEEVPPLVSRPNLPGVSPCACELTQLTWRKYLRLWVDPTYLEEVPSPPDGDNDHGVGVEHHQHRHYNPCPLSLITENQKTEGGKREREREKKNNFDIIVYFKRTILTRSNKK